VVGRATQARRIVVELGLEGLYDGRKFERAGIAASVVLRFVGRRAVVRTDERESVHASWVRWRVGVLRAPALERVGEDGGAERTAPTGRDRRPFRQRTRQGEGCRPIELQRAEAGVMSLLWRRRLGRRVRKVR